MRWQAAYGPVIGYNKNQSYLAFGRFFESTVGGGGGFGSDIQMFKARLMSSMKINLRVVLLGIAVSLLCGVVGSARADDETKPVDRPNVLFLSLIHI